MKWKVVLLLALVLSALWQISVAHEHRQLLQRWQQQDALRNNLQRQYSMLLLERSTLAAHNRIDRLARQELNMTEPKNIQVLTR
ncbi:MAG: cell division protein FtsL [Pseudomonadota bacterium]|jgi:cell division protein FtsL